MKNTVDFKVYYKDTDAEGVVYYANYLGWFEAGRCELLEQIGISLNILKAEKNIVFAVKNVNCEYLKAARLGDEVTVETIIKESGPVRIIFAQKVRKDSEVLCQAETTLFPIDMNSFRPTKIPQEIKALIEKV